MGLMAFRALGLGGFEGFRSLFGLLGVPAFRA